MQKIHTTEQDTGKKELNKGLILFAHGSRDPVWAHPFEAMLQKIKLTAPDVPCALAYLELMQPDFATAVDQLVVAQVSRIRVLPVFLAVGKHLRVDLPQFIADAQARHPALVFETLPAAGLSPTIQNAMVELALSSADGTNESA